MMEEHENKSGPMPEGQPPAEGEKPAIHAEVSTTAPSEPETTKLAENDPVELNPAPHSPG
jgi:hypothetical protein